jgi:hypothetical protein
MTTNFMQGPAGPTESGDFPVFTFKLDPGKTPKGIDLAEGSRQALFGIYRLDGDDLTICCSITGDKGDRPSTFAGYWKAGTYSMLLVLRRHPAKANTQRKDGVSVKKSDSKLWAAISATQPIFHEGDTGPGAFQIHFVVVNDGDKTIDPECESSRLIVNGKDLDDWSFHVSNGPKDRRWNALPAKDHLSFSYALSKNFAKPGVYKVVWKGKQFQAPEIVFRVLPRRK